MVVLTYVGNDCKWLGSILILSVGTSDPVAYRFPESSRLTSKLNRQTASSKIQKKWRQKKKSSD
jgi:hypothetical protein